MREKLLSTPSQTKFALPTVFSGEVVEVFGYFYEKFNPKGV
jgi:hypothetical protein